MKQKLKTKYVTNFIVSKVGTQQNAIPVGVTLCFQTSLVTKPKSTTEQQDKEYTKIINFTPNTSKYRP